MGLLLHESGDHFVIVLIQHIGAAATRSRLCVPDGKAAQYTMRAVDSSPECPGPAGRAYQRAKRRPAMKPAITSMAMASGYQVATKNGESSLHWAA